MADVSKIVLLNGDEYDLKDSTARSGLSGKADKATTLSGYGITNAYTKTEVDSLVSSVFTYKGSKSTYDQVSALTDMKTGDVWQVTADNSEYVYNGSSWEKLGPTIDLSGYLTSVSVAGQSLTPGSNSITAEQLKTALGLGSAAYASTASSVGNNTNLPTGAAVQSYVTGLGYTTNTGTVISVATGAGLTGGTITGSGTIKADLKSETKSSLTAASKGSTTDREYAVGLDANGDLSVNVPWENTQTVTGVKGSSESSYRTGNVSISASNIGLGNVENKSSATIRGELTSQNVIDALGYTPGSSGGTVTKVTAGTGLSGGDITTEGTIALKGQNIYYATCPTAAATAAKVATTTNGDFELTTGAMVRVKFTYSNTYNGTVTLNVDSKGAKNIATVGTTTTSRYFWTAGEVVDFVYDGTYFVMSDAGTATTSYYGITKLEDSTSSTSTTTAATPNSVKTAYDLANAAAPQSTTYTKTEVQNYVTGLGYTSNTGTVTSVATGTGLTGGPITTSGTISLAGGVVTAGSAGPTAAVTGNDGTTVAIPRITVDEYGRVTDLTSYNLTNTNNRKAFYGTCSTAAGTAAKIVALSNTAGWELVPGTIIGVKFTTGNTADNVTLNVNNSGAKQIYYNTSVHTGHSYLVLGAANRIYYYQYDGTYWVWMSNGYVETSGSAHCPTSASTAAKVAGLNGFTLKEQSFVSILMAQSNSATSALTLDINSTGAKPIYINGAASSSSNHTLPAGTYIVFYDGTNYHFRTDNKLPADITGSATSADNATNDADGNNISSTYTKKSEFAVVTGTCNSASDWSSYQNYPTGFSYTNCHIVSFEISHADMWKVGDGMSATTGRRTFAGMDVTGIRVYNNDSNFYTVPWRVCLRKI